MENSPTNPLTREKLFKYFNIKTSNKNNHLFFIFLLFMMFIFMLCFKIVKFPQNKNCIKFLRPWPIFPNNYNATLCAMKFHPDTTIFLLSPLNGPIHLQQTMQCNGTASLSSPSSFSNDEKDWKTPMNLPETRQKEKKLVRILMFSGIFFYGNNVTGFIFW